MTTLAAAVVGGFAGLGVVLAVSGARGASVLSFAWMHDGWIAARVDRLLLRIALACTAAVLALLLAHWTVLAIAAAILGWMAPTWRNTRDAHSHELALVEAIASWTEQIRDTIAAANGLEHALVAAAALAPLAIAGAVERLASHSEYEGLSDSLRRFADDVDHPIADFVAAALIIANDNEARDLGPLLGQLAEAARDEARMRTRVWVARARSRSAVRIIVAAVVAMVLGLVVFDRAYLAPYDDAAGQIVLGVIMATFAAAIVLMQRIGTIALPDRFVALRDVEAAAG